MNCTPPQHQQSVAPPPPLTATRRSTSMSVDVFDHSERIVYFSSTNDNNGSSSASFDNGSFSSSSSSSDQMEKIAQLNNKGIEYMCSELSQAAMYFWRSLDMAKDCQGHHHGAAANSSSSSAAELKNSIAAAINSTNGKKSSNNKNMHIHQHRDEFDEAMRRYSEPIAIDSSSNSYLSIPSSTATILFNLGLLNLRMNKDEEASSCFSLALHLAIQEQRSDDCSSSNSSNSGVGVVAILHNIGYLQYRNEEFENAIKTYRKALRIAKDMERDYNNKSTTTSCPRSVMLDIASTLDCLGILKLHLSVPDTEQAMSLCTESLSIQRQILGSDCANAKIASTLNNIGRIHFIKGEYECSLKMYGDSLEMRRRLFNASTSTTASSNNNVATNDKFQNMHLLEIATTMFNVAQTHHQLGRFSEAMELYEESLGITKKQLGAKHFDNAVILKYMGQIQHERKDYDAAIGLYEQALAVEKTVLGKYHEEVAVTLNKLGNLYYQKGDYAKATKVYEEGLAVERAILDVFHTNIAVTLCNIGHICKLRNEYTQALRLYKEAVAIQRHSLGRTHPEVSTTLLSMASIHYQSNSYRKAFNIYKEVLEIQSDSYGDNDLRVASTLNSIGLVLYKLELFPLAIQAFQKNLSIRSAALDSHHRDNAIILFNIATVYLELGDDEEAIDYYHKALLIERKAIADNNNATKGDEQQQQSLVSTIQQIGLLHQQRGEFDDAIKCFEEVLEIQQKQRHEEGQVDDNNSDNHHTDIAETLNNLGNVYLQRGNAADLVHTLSDAVRHLRVVGKNENDLNISGFHLYEISKRHPECASVA